MECAFPYLGYSIKVYAQAPAEPAARSMMLHDAGFVSVVEIFSANGRVPAFPQFRVTDENGRGFDSQVDAMLKGFTAGQSIVDELLPVAAIN
ncbi:hypothetical protein [Burkholderia sp. Ac-20365]|uniref:hypothetical protein n=1 Tax=Burkholderia sp. Ac-20365 TaxID=2703897 RepID=UPI00197B13AA|nr:hypothetical protein [Burkholderia sp. Ac-20365]MBN3761607.1 hypothetical protein [Burkholderia sp. Ac-20365]